MINVQKGFTLLEIVISITLLVLIMGVLMNGFGPWLSFRQKVETEQILKDLQQAAASFYRANHWKILTSASPNVTVSAEFSGPFSEMSTGAAPAPGIKTNCRDTNRADAQDMIALPADENNLKALEPYLSRSLKNVVSDGYNHVICVLVGKILAKEHQGALIYHQPIAFISSGDNGHFDTGTSFVRDGDGYVLLLEGDDTGIMMDGLQVSMENYNLTLNRLQRYARSYETYFNIRYLSNMDRDITRDYFYANNGTNNGDTGNVSTGTPSTTTPEVLLPMTNQTLPSGDYASIANTISSGSDANLQNVTKSVSGATPTNNNSFSGVLGISQSDSVNAWGFPIFVDNASNRVKAGVESGNKIQPPFTAVFSTFLPGSGLAALDTRCNGNINDASSICQTYLTSTAVGQY